MDDEGVEFVLAEVGVVQGKAEIDAELEVEGKQNLFSFTVGVLEDGESEDDEIGKTEGFVG